MPQISPVTHVIFDVDGLLLDTESLYSEIMSSIVEPYGKKFTWDVKVQQMGKKMHEAGQILIDALELPFSVDEYEQKVIEGQKKLFPTAKLMPGAEKLIRHLDKHKVPMALATGSSKEEFEIKASSHKDLFEVVSHSVFSSSDPEVKLGKPAPDCFVVCGQRFPDKPPPEKVLVFEDAPNGVEGALAAGMQVVWIPDSNADKSKLKDHVQRLLTSLVEFQPEEFGLPAYDS